MLYIVGDYLATTGSQWNNMEYPNCYSDYNSSKWLIQVRYSSKREEYMEGGVKCHDLKLQCFLNILFMISEDEIAKRKEIVIENKYGYKIKLYDYRCERDCDFIFEDGIMVFNRRYFDFIHGKIMHPVYKQIEKHEMDRRLHMVVENTAGYHAKIKEYRSPRDIDIIFIEDGEIINTSFQHFNHGEFSHPKYKYNDITGQRFGKLVARKRFGGNDKYGNVLWYCDCDCGGHKIASAQNLKNGSTNSCGCLFSESMSNRITQSNITNINMVIKNYKRGAKTRNLTWNLSFEQVKNIIEKPCVYCGGYGTNKIKANKYGDDYFYSGIDRINSNIGYEINNVASCCNICNRAKNNMELDDFNKWRLQLAKYVNKEYIE